MVCQRCVLPAPLILKKGTLNVLMTILDIDHIFSQQSEPSPSTFLNTWNILKHHMNKGRH